MFSTQQYFGFDPRTIPGCQLWLDAADTTSNSMVLSGGNVSVWRDKSGNGNNTTTATGPPLLSNSAINGLPAIRLQTGSYFAIEPLTNAANQTTVSAFVIATVTSNASSYGRLLSYGRTVDGTANNDFSTVSNFTFLRESTGQAMSVYRNSPSVVPNRTMAITYGTPFLMECIFDGTNGNPFLNGVSNATFSSTGTFTFNRLGIGYNINTKTDPIDVYNGLVGEIIIYYTALTAIERQRVEGYLMAKWGLLSTMTSISSPLSIPGCQLWLDAADTTSTSMTLSGGNVSVWRDKSGNGNNTTTATGPPLLSNSAINGRSAIRLQTGSYFAIEPLATPANQTTVSVFVVATMTSNAIAYGRLFSTGRIADGTANNDFQTVSNFTFARDNLNQTIAIFRNVPSAVANSSFAITYGSPFLMECIFDGTNGNPFLNGNSNTAFSSTGTFTFNRIGIGYNINTKTDPNEVYTGLVGEVIVYYTALTTTQRQQIEGYLANKWGLSFLLPASNPLSPSFTNTTYLISRPISRVFQPTDILGCQLWFDAADSSTITPANPVNGTAISQWNDKSGNGYHATQATAGNRPTYSLTGRNISFTRTSSQFFNLPDNALPSGNSSYSYFMVVTFASTVDGLGIIGGGNFGTNNQAFGIRSVGTNANIINFWWNADLETTSGGVYTVNVPLLLQARYAAGGTRSILRNGLELVSNSPAARAQTTTNNAIGRTTPANSEFFNGTMNEIIVFNRDLTTSERQQIEGYIVWKWGLPPSSIVSPLNISGCQLWFDAADSSTITPANPTNGTAISQWNDKSGNGYHATQATAGNRPTYSLTGRNINFTRASSQFFNLPDNALPSGNSSYFYFMVVTFASLVDGLGIIGGGNFGTTNQAFGIRSLSTNANIINFWWNSDLETTSGGVYTVNVPLLLQARYAAGGTRSILKNGIQLVSNSPAARAQGISNNAIGRTTPANSEFFNGTMNEIIVFNRDLTISERQQVEKYLAMKWGLGLISSISQPFLQQSVPSTQLFAPPLLSNLSLWLDAADSNTFTFSSGSNIIQWRDKSSTSNHVSALSGTTTRSGSSVVLSSSFMTFTRSALFSGTTGTSVFFVFSIPSNFGNGHPIGNDLASGGQSSSFNWSDNVLYENIGFSTRQVVGAVFPGNTNQIYTNIANRGGNTLILRNGTQVFSAAYGSAYAGSTGYRIGSRGPGESYPFTGVLYEIVYYSTTLTLSQQQQVEGYLAWKWGLQNSLPTTHPYYKFRP